MPHRSKYGFRPSATTLVPNFDPDILKATHKSSSPPTQTTTFLSLPPEIRNKIYSLTTRPTSFRPGARGIPNLSLAQTSEQIRAENALAARSVVRHFWSYRDLSSSADPGPRGLEIYLAPTCTGRTVFNLLVEDVAERFDYFLIYVGCRGDLAQRSPEWGIRPRAVYVWRPRGRVEGCGAREMVHGDNGAGWIASLDRAVREKIRAAEDPEDSDQEAMQVTEGPKDPDQQKVQVADRLRELGFQGEGDEEKEIWIRREVLERILRELDAVYELEKGVKSVWRTVLAAKKGVVSREIYKGFYWEHDNWRRSDALCDGPGRSYTWANVQDHRQRLHFA